MHRVQPLTWAALCLAGLFTFSIVSCGSGGSTAPQETASPSATPAAPSPQVDAPTIDLETSVATTYYTVTGTSTESIFASIEANGPTDSLGRKGSGLTSVHWEYKWSGDEAPSGVCSIRELTIRADITVELPQHENEDDLSPSTRANWDAYADGVAVHEQTHVDIYLQGAEEIRTAMEQVGFADSCDELKAQLDRVWRSEQARINALQEAFHNEEDARLAASRGPLAAQIDANRAELNRLQAQVSTLDEQINLLRAEIAVFDNEVANIDAQIQQINEQFPNDLPPTIRDRLEELIQQSNDLLAAYNHRVGEHNSAILSRNALSAEYDALLRTTNELVEQYNWTR